MKRIFACTLAAALFFLTGAQLFFAQAQSTELSVQQGTEIVIGSVTPLSGYFTTDLWGANSSDMDVRDLLHGYSIISIVRDAVVFNPTVISNSSMMTDEDGGQTYTLTFASGLTYNDGTPISAADYAFSLLLTCSPQIYDISGEAKAINFIEGVLEYHAGLDKVLKGVRLLPENSLSIHVSREFATYFYDIARLDIVPYPISVIAPNCEVKDDGQGVYLSPNDTFSADILRETMLNPKTGYVFNPRVTSGPYSLESYDVDSHTAKRVINERFLGNSERKRPHVERIVFRPVQNDTMLRELAEGTVDVLVRVADPGVVAEGIRYGFSASKAYSRASFTTLSFACETGATSSVAVRQAIARCLDKDDLIRAALGERSSALPVHGYYGNGQWMVNQVFEADEALGLTELDVSKELKKLAVHMDLDKANELLASDGWVLNADGFDYQAGDGVRYRTEGGVLEALTVHWAKPENSLAADALQSMLESSFAKAGIGLDVTTMPFTDMLLHYFRATERTYDLFFLTNNFRHLFEPYFDFNTAEIYQGTVNVSGLRDEKLMHLGLDIMLTEAGDVRAYVEKWLAFQEHWVELMPMVPLYSNVFYDLYAQNIQGYNVDEQVSWVQTILYTYIDGGM